MSNEHPWWLESLLGPIFTLVVGGIMVQRFFVRRANQAAFVDHLIKEITELREDAVVYWSSDPGTNISLDARKLEVRIKTRIHSLNSDLEHFGVLLEPSWVRAFRCVLTHCYGANDWDYPTRASAFLDEMNVLYDECTGGNFESADREPSIEQCMAICSSISRLKSSLLKVKI